MNGADTADALEVVALLAKTKQGLSATYPPWAAFAEVPSSLESLVYCLAEGPPSQQDKAIEILSRLCGDQPVVLGDLLIARSSSIGSLANRIMNSSSLEVRVGGTALLVCSAKEHRQRSMEALDLSGYSKPLIYALVDMIKQNSICSSLEIEVRTPRGFFERSALQEGDDFDVLDPSTVLGGTVALWLLSIISSCHNKNKLIVMEAGGLEALSDKLLSYTSNSQAEFEDTEGIWISALLLAILFQDATVVLSPTTMRIIPSLAHLLRSDEMIHRFFAAHAMASLVCNGSKGMDLTIANSGSDTNKLIMAEAGALDALTKYLSLSPKDSTEASISELLRILFKNPEIIRYEASLISVNQLVAVLHLGSRDARFSAARALQELFDAQNIRDSEFAWQAVQPLIDMLNAASESEQEAALVALIKLTSGNTLKAAFFTDLEGDPLESIYKIFLLHVPWN
ncbi:hypothetical protein GH714_001356 [Hevea brasiliensis]|uniref:Armadillo repeat-containing domain-containing protein n=1 Tax=Hevea brasiliensis TaxID=3981 RepID=A0A6A6L9J3_HEVBR|nr:hypothetical protein GH714_001356 [Hevea brasiliensis]